MKQAIMKSLLRNKILLITLILITPGCRKDPPVVIEPPIIDCNCVEDSCEAIPDDSGIGHNFIVEGAQYFKPCFNPNNSDEFVFIRTGVSPSPALIKYNLSTQTETILATSIASNPSWGRQGWITLPGSNNIFRIKDDGTDLAQITWGEDDNFPNFNYQGNKIYYNRNKNYTNAELDANPDLYKEDKIMVIDVDGNVLDSIMADNVIPGNYYQKWSMADFESDNIIYFIGGLEENQGIYRLDESTNVITPVSLWNNAFNGRENVADMVYFDGSIYFSKWRNGVYKANIQTGEITTLIDGCETKYYHQLTISSDGKYLFGEKVIYDPIGGLDIVENHEIWSISLDSCYQEKILGE